MDANSTDLFETHRPRLESLAYHMLGRRAPARDLVQDAFLRWHDLSEEEIAAIEDPKAYLETIVSRLAIDRLRSARSRRESYTGPWLPEPVATGDSAPDEHLERETSLSLGVLFLLERLNPVERAVFLLREVFDVGYERIAQIVDRSVVNCRQIAHRARERVRESEPRFRPSPEKKNELLAKLLQASAEGNMDELIDLLEEDAVHYSDGGEEALAARAPVEGPLRMARFFIGLFEHFYADAKIEMGELNGEPGVLVLREGTLCAAWTFEMGERGLRRSFAVLNPDKLAELGRSDTGYSK